MSKPMAKERREELRQIAGGLAGEPKSDWMDELLDEIDRLSHAIEKLVKLVREVGPPSPGHSCGPESGCDMGCMAYAEFEKTIRAVIKGA